MDFKIKECIQLEKPTKEALDFSMMQAGMFKVYLADFFDKLKQGKKVEDLKELLYEHTEESIRIVEFYLCKNYSDWKKVTLVELINEYRNRSERTIYGIELFPELIKTEK